MTVTRGATRVHRIRRIGELHTFHHLQLKFSAFSRSPFPKKGFPKDKVFERIITLID